MTSYPLRTKRYKISLAEDQLKRKLTHSFASLVSFRAGLQGEKVILVLGLPQQTKRAKNSSGLYNNKQNFTGRVTLSHGSTLPALLEND